nr:adenylate/guanylate cyclase domain-containing protein [Alteromonas sp. ASW11-130]
MQHYTKQRWQQIKALQSQTNELLRTFLPQPQHLSRAHWPSGYQERFENVCVLFADLQGYTQLSQHYDDDEIVTILDTLYQQFDQLAREFQIEKIKTNGDEYMAVAGLPFSASDCSSKLERIDNIITFARHLINTVNQLFTQLHTTCNLRVGIAMGSVTGGVIGSQRLCFDVWGKTVNRAASLEQVAAPGYIAVCDVIARNAETAGVYQILRVERENQSHHIIAPNS